MSDDDLRRLERERQEADRRYNEALTLLDAAVQAQLTLPPAPDGVDDGPLGQLNEEWRRLREESPSLGPGLRGKARRLIWRVVAPLFERQRAIDQAIVEHFNRDVMKERAAREALGVLLAATGEHVSGLVAFQSRLIQYLQQVTPYVDTKDRAETAMLTVWLRDVRDDLDRQVQALESTVGLVQQQLATLKREVERSAASPVVSPGPKPGVRSPKSTGAHGAQGASALNAYKYVGFEDQFRGSQEEIRRRLADYCPFFEGASDVLDVGCGRGEFLELLRERGVSGRGVELNHEMVEVCRARGLEVAEGDVVGYLGALPDGALGGLFAGQVVEHLEPDYLMRFLELAYLKLRPGSKIVLETINVDSWSAFFGPYLRDITHAQPLPPATLTFLLRASGFQRVALRSSAPMPDEVKLTRLSVQAAATGSPGMPDLAKAFNQNVDRLNALLFGDSDYAAIAERL